MVTERKRARPSESTALPGGECLLAQSTIASELEAGYRGNIGVNRLVDLVQRDWRDDRNLVL
jgi:hypothetical protein